VHPIRIAAQLHPQHGSYSDLRAAVGRVDELGYDLLYTWDHFFPLYGEPDGAHFECWTMLAAWAEQTDGVEIGALVSCNSYRNPSLLADMARTIDHISGGRFILGLGSGWFERDYDEYGYEFGTTGERLLALRAAIPVMQRRLAVLNPPPTRRMPIMIGGWGERLTLRMVAEHADIWHARFPDSPDEVVPKIAALRRWCDEVGRDPGDIEWSLGLDPDDLDRFLTEDVDDYVDLGFTQFTLGFNGPGWGVDRGADWLAWRDERNGA
jgi:probable F420-dependent oxidoreductase